MKLSTLFATSNTSPQQPQTKNRPDGTRGVSATDDSPINILIVDDESKNLTVLETILDNPGYRLVRAESADQALLALVVQEFALLILDIRMPGMSGFELAEIIKERKKTAGVPIIFLTAFYNEDQHVLVGYGTGAVDFLHKPVNAAILRSKVAVFAELYRKSRECGLVNDALLAEVTERRRAEEQLRELNETLEHRVTERTDALRDSEMRYRRLFEAAQDGVLILDFENGEIVDVNPFMTQLLGYSYDDFLGMELWNLGLLNDVPETESALQELKAKGYLRYERLALQSKDGRRFEVEVVANVYSVNHQNVIQCNIRDITLRGRLEKQLQEQADKVIDLNRRKDEFLAMLSHELRSPLAPISNALQLLQLQQDSETELQQQARNIIERQMRQLQHLVDDLLEVSRITTGRLHLRKESVDVSEIIRGAMETACPIIDQRKHELTLSLPSERIWLNADVSRMEQVLVNLLTNAAKYTDEGGHIWLSVEVSSEETSSTVQAPAHPQESTAQKPTAQEIVFRVRDSGVGIDPTLLPHIFDLFTQAERSLDRSQGGLGIGLALVHRLTEMHGGRVEARSVLGQGSEFIVRLPITTSDTPESQSAVTDCGPLITRCLRVLVVDDNADTVESFSILLNASGHNVRTAHDGPAAVQAALDYQPDVALLDIGLPGLDGYQVAKRIRQEPALKNVVLVALTGYGQDSDRQTSLQAGFDHHLVKPARLEQLTQILAMVAERRP